MAIIKVNNTSEESSVNFLTNQSSILHTSNTNKITVNGVNVFVDKPKVGDIMCVTRYTDEGGALLSADKQKVKWIDGLSINPKQLSQKYEPVGICVAINGNKAMVRYREEQTKRWSVSDRWEMPQLLPIIAQKSHSFRINLDGKDHSNRFEYRYNNFSTGDEVEEDFIRQLNNWFLANARDYSAEFQFSNGQATRIVNALISEGRESKTFSMADVNDGTIITPTRAMGKPVKAVNWYYKNNGFKTDGYGGCCRAVYYEFIQDEQNAPTSAMENINYVPGGLDDGKLPASLVDFNNNDNCKILRDNFATYDKYFDSIMVKFPCGAGGVIAETPSGKENTYKLANTLFANNTTGNTEILYPAANWAASINVNGPNLGEGNWWLPSAAEMIQMMRDITYNTYSWETKPDIVNRVLEKLTSINNSGWSMLSAFIEQCTSSIGQDGIYVNSNAIGTLIRSYFFNSRTVSPITIYEF